MALESAERNDVLLAREALDVVLAPHLRLDGVPARLCLAAIGVLALGSALLLLALRRAPASIACPAPTTASATTRRAAS